MVNDIFEEVEQDVRRDFFIGLLKRYKTYLISVLSLVLLGVGGNFAWNSYILHKSQERGQVLYAIESQLENKNTEEALLLLEQLFEGESAEITYLAHMKTGEILKSVERNQEAADAFRRAAEQLPDNKVLSDLALLRVAVYLMETQQLAEASPLLEKLSGSQSPYRLSALELFAVLQLELGEVEVARSSFQAILDSPGVSKEMIDRVNAIINNISG